MKRLKVIIRPNSLTRYAFKVFALCMAIAGERELSLAQQSLEFSTYFEKVIEGPHVSDEFSTSGASWADYNNDGNIDLYIANRDGEVNVLYRNNGDESFSRMTSDDIGELANQTGNSRASYWADVDNDGDLDVFITNLSSNDLPERDALYLNNGDGTFAKQSDDDPVERADYSQGGAWGDYDNDGYVDLFVGTWDFDGEPAPNLLFQNDNKRHATHARHGSRGVLDST